MDTLYIGPKEHTGSEKKITTFRIPADLLAELDTLAAKTNRCRNEIVLILLEFGLEHAEIEE